jgi:hypothetical protein
VAVVRSNNALYDCEVKQDRIGVAEADSMRPFLTAIAPYLLEASILIPPSFVAALGTTKGELLPNDRVTALRTGLVNLERHVRGPGGMQETQVRVLRELERMRQQLGQDSINTSEFRAALACERGSDGQCVRLPFVSGIVENLAMLQAAAAALADNGDADENTAALTKAASDMLGSSDKLVAAAYAVEALALRAARAEASFPCAGAVRVDWNSGRRVRIRLTPSTAPELSRAAGAKPLDIEASFLPDWLIRPALGVSLLYVPDAVFATYGTQKVGTEVRVSEKGTQDQRFAYGLTLGLTWRGLDGRDAKLLERDGQPAALARIGSGITFWIPEITINPLKDVRAVALGVSVSYGMLKLGVGRAWIRHSELQKGQTVGSVITDADALAAGQSYGRALPYFSISLVGLPPFLR